jgi:hypothetical protein
MSQRPIVMISKDMPPPQRGSNGRFDRGGSLHAPGKVRTPMPTMRTTGTNSTTWLVAIPFDGRDQFACFQSDIFDRESVGVIRRKVPTLIGVANF